MSGTATIDRMAEQSEFAFMGTSPDTCEVCDRPLPARHLIGDGRCCWSCQRAELHAVAVLRRKREFLATRLAEIDGALATFGRRSAHGGRNG